MEEQTIKKKSLDSRNENTYYYKHRERILGDYHMKKSTDPDFIENRRKYFKKYYLKKREKIIKQNKQNKQNKKDNTKKTDKKYKFNKKDPRGITPVSLYVSFL